MEAQQTLVNLRRLCLRVSSITTTNLVGTASLTRALIPSLATTTLVTATLVIATLVTQTLLMTT